ncbi:MAG: hypothetical protein KKD24_00800, partial [Proteobacteria bacterium]|nr:hypothetical protein [Pseudomonadota bacterium]
NQQKGEQIYQKTADSIHHSHNDRQRTPYFVVKNSIDTQDHASYTTALKKEVLINRERRGLCVLKIIRRDDGIPSGQIQ